MQWSTYHSFLCVHVIMMFFIKYRVLNMNLIYSIMFQICVCFNVVYELPVMV